MLNSQLTAKDRELTLLQSRLDTVAEECERRRRQYDETREELNSERAKLQEKVDAARGRAQEAMDQAMQKRLEDAREIALYKQKMEFQEKKIDDL